MKKHLIIFVFIFISIQFSKAQETILYGLKSTPTNSNFVSFDYMNQTYDTLFQLPFFANISTCITIDPFKKIIYLSDYSGTIYAINIDSANYHIVGNFSSQIIGGILELQYDYFSNCLIIEDENSIRKYNLNNQNFDFITNVYPICSVMDATPRSTYNQSTQNFYAINILDKGNSNHQFFSILVDCINNYIIDTVNYYPSDNLFGGLTYNLTDNNYYAYNYYQKKAIKISSITGAETTICNFNYQLGYSNQQPAFDFNNNNYLLPFYSGSNKLAIINVNSGNIDTVDFYPFTHQIFFGGRNPILKSVNNYLYGSYCDNYTWYLNGTIIPGSTIQTFYPSVGGYYKFSTNIGAQTYFSNEIYFSLSSINEVNKNSLIMPNPATDNLTIQIAAPYRGIMISIYNVEGKQLINQKLIVENNQFDISSLSKGIYFLKIFTDKGIGMKKFIKE